MTLINLQDSTTLVLLPVILILLFLSDKRQTIGSVDVRYCTSTRTIAFKQSPYSDIVWPIDQPVAPSNNNIAMEM